MMSSPENYREEFLVGKSKEEIASRIRNLKREIGRLKNVLEHPCYECAMRPGEYVQLKMSYLYLEEAKKAFEELGGTYVPGEAEQKIAKFNEDLDSVAKITFEHGSCMGRRKIRTIEVCDDGLKMEEAHRFCFDGEVKTFYSKEKNALIERLQELNLGGWRKHYDTFRFGVAVMDGKSWSLEISFSNGRRAVRFLGENAYPYNFDDLEKLFDDFLQREEE